MTLRLPFILLTLLFAAASAGCRDRADAAPTDAAPTGAPSGAAAPATVTAATATATASPSPPSVTTTPAGPVAADKLAEQGYAAFEQMAAVVDEHRGDCDKLGAALKAWQTRNQATLDAIGERKKNGTAAEKKALDDLKVRARPLLKTKIGPEVGKCERNKEIREVFSKL